VGPIASGNKVVASTDFRQQLYPALAQADWFGNGGGRILCPQPSIGRKYQQYWSFVACAIWPMSANQNEWQEYAAMPPPLFAIGFIKNGPVDPQQ